MTKLIIQEKRLSQERVRRVMAECYGKDYAMRRKRGQIYLFFPKKDLTHSHVEIIARKLNMEVISESFVRAVIGYGI